MSNQNMSSTQVLQRLHDPNTIRSQAQRMLHLAKEHALEHFVLHLEKMKDTASFIVEVMTDNYPTLDIPYHSRWRHFEAGGMNCLEQMRQRLSHLPPEEHGKILYELIIISVFLDAGAGNTWCYKETTTQKVYSRSEGLALASLAMYQSGAFSSHPGIPYRVDAERLLAFSEYDLQDGFQISLTNPLAGAAGRVALLNQLGTIIKQKSNYFGHDGRLGNFYSYIHSLQIQKSLSAVTLFQAVLNGFNDIWPVRTLFDGVSLGDVWIHNALKTTILGSEYIPFHKLSQWLTYSLIEPLEALGIQVIDIGQLTGLAEYRNGGLLIDSGLLEVKNKDMFAKAHNPGSELIIEWRALTIALLDELAVLIRQQLHKDEKTLPLAKILQGGTWQAGRQIAQMKRKEGTPPLSIISDGTVF